MMFALGAAGSLIDALASLGSSKSSSATNSTGQSQGTANPFDIGGGTQTPGADRLLGQHRRALDLAADHERADRGAEPVGHDEHGADRSGGLR